MSVTLCTEIIQYDTTYYIILHNGVSKKHLNKVKHN
jgi:hypothetical protein